MKKFTKENWFKLVIIFCSLTIIAGYFYWHEVRPTKIKKECSMYLNNGLSGFVKSTIEKEQNYEVCLKKHGL